MNALIERKSLAWALQRSASPVEAVAKTAHIKPTLLISFVEKGEGEITFHQAQNLANALHIPLGYLFLSSAPSDDLPLPDLRTIGNKQLQKPSADFLDLLDDVLRKQDWYHDHLKQEKRASLNFIKRFSLESPIDKVAADISQTLDIPTLRNDARSWEQFLREFMESAQEEGILVLRSGIVGNNTRRKLNVAEFRGFAISDDLAPLVFLNGRDSKAAQIFTLAHELAHLWIGESGVSNLDISETTISQRKDIELFCNGVAAELLVPKSKFLSEWGKTSSVEDNLYALVRTYRVSSLVILRRAIDLKLISSDTYRRAYDKEIEIIKSHESHAAEEGGSGGNFYSTFFLRNSDILTTALVSSALEGKVLYRDASRLLGVQVNTLYKIAATLGIK